MQLLLLFSMFYFGFLCLNNLATRDYFPVQSYLISSRCFHFLPLKSILFLSQHHRIPLGGCFRFSSIINFLYSLISLLYSPRPPLFPPYRSSTCLTVSFQKVSVIIIPNSLHLLSFPPLITNKTWLWLASLCCSPNTKVLPKSPLFFFFFFQSSSSQVF